MKRQKVIQAVAIGVIAWLLGFLGILLFYNQQYFPVAVVIVVIIGAPVPVWFISQRFLTRIPQQSLSLNALSFSAIVLIIQFFLDGLFALSIFFFNVPQLSVSAVKGLFLALEIGYFYFLLIPWLTSRRLKKPSEDWCLNIYGILKGSPVHIASKISSTLPLWA